MANRDTRDIQLRLRSDVIDFGMKMDGRLKLNQHKDVVGKEGMRRLEATAYCSRPPLDMVSAAEKNLKALRRAIEDGADPNVIFQHAADASNYQMMASNAYYIGFVGLADEPEDGIEP